MNKRQAIKRCGSGTRPKKKQNLNVNGLPVC